MARRGSIRRCLLGLALMVPGASPALGQVATPAPRVEHNRGAGPHLVLAGRVTDAAHLMTAPERARLEETLAAFERRTRHQLVVVTVPTLGGQDIATYARDLGNRWGIGRSGHDDGIIILVAPVERTARIAVGLGLEARLTDAACQRVIGAHMLPAFAQGRFFDGLSAGLAAITAIF